MIGFELIGDAVMVVNGLAKCCVIGLDDWTLDMNYLAVKTKLPCAVI